MRILIQSRVPRQIRLIAQLAADLGPSHRVAVVRRQRKERVWLERKDIPVYNLRHIMAQGRSAAACAWAELKDSDPHAVEYAGIRLGNVSTYERLWCERRGIPQPDLLKETLGEVLALQAVLGDFRPDVMMVWNGIPAEMQISRELARRAGASIFCMERGLLPDSMTIDPLGVNAQSILCTEYWDGVVADPPDGEIIHQVRAYLDVIHAAGRSVVSQAGSCSSRQLRDRLGVTAETRLLLVPEQIDSDSNILFNAPGYPTNQGVLESLILAVKDRGPCAILYKPHPESPTPLAAERVLGAHGHVVSDVNVNSLIDAADAVVVRNSTVGLEAVGHDKPVVVLGKAAWSHKGCTYDVASPDRLPETLHEAVARGFTPAMRRAADIFFAHIAQRRHYFLKGHEPFPGANASILNEIVSARPLKPVHYDRNVPLRPVVNRYRRTLMLKRFVHRLNPVGVARRAAAAVHRVAGKARRGVAGRR